MRAICSRSLFFKEWWEQIAHGRSLKWAILREWAKERILTLHLIYFSYMLISFCYTASSTSYIFVYLLCLHMLQFNCLKPNNTLLFHKKFSISSLKNLPKSNNAVYFGKHITHTSTKVVFALYFFTIPFRKPSVCL